MSPSLPLEATLLGFQHLASAIKAHMDRFQDHGDDRRRRCGMLLRLALAGALRAKSASEAQLLLGGAGVADGHDLVDSRAAASAAAAATAAAAAAAAADDDDDDGCCCCCCCCARKDGVSCSNGAATGVTAKRHDVIVRSGIATSPVQTAFW